MTAGDPLRQILRFQIESLREANREQEAANMRLMAERDALLIEVERMRLGLPDESIWSREDPEDEGDPWRWFWVGYGIVMVGLGLALLTALWVAW